jgi:hypothetical protein
VYKMKPQNQRHIVLADMMSYKLLLHEVEEMQEGQLGTTIYDDDLKDQDKTLVKSAIFQFNLNNLNVQKNLLSTLVLGELGGQLCPIVLSEQT